MSEQINEVFFSLKYYCESHHYRGWDPYDSLNSKVFQLTPFFCWRFARLAWIQGFKRSSINFRRLLLVPKEHNAKGIGLFLSGYCNIYKVQESSGRNDFGTQAELMGKVNFLADLLISLKSPGFSGACWGYNFDWQSKAFFLPRNTPTVVATSFAVEALLNAYEVTRNEKYLNVALSSATFILKDLNRIEKPNGFMFSYSPLDNRAVYNATLLGSKTLALLVRYQNSDEYKNAAYLSARSVCDLQNSDGSFPHSDQVGNRWRDNFHTGFKLESLSIYQKCFKDQSFSDNIEKGFTYWINNYFNPSTGRPFYYDNDHSLVDLHCTAQALSTLYKLDKMPDHVEFAEKIIGWASNNMQSEDGSFYFQMYKNKINKIKYMRWPNAWMFYGMSYYLLYKIQNEKNQGDHQIDSY
jgi:rhamnogalacturonyl hydrolase YesR